MQFCFSAVWKPLATALDLVSSESQMDPISMRRSARPDTVKWEKGNVGGSGGRRRQEEEEREGRGIMGGSNEQRDQYRVRRRKENRREEEKQ